MNLRETAVNGAIEELKKMVSELQEELYKAGTIKDTLIIAEELTEARAALEDAIIHKAHFIKYGYIYQ